MHFEKLGPYRIGKRLGRGGMGEVYEGVNVETGQPAAIKVLSPALATAEGFRERFEAEIDSLRMLKHPNIVQLYGYGEQDGFLFYAMELVAGRSLEDELASGRRFNWREVTEIGIRLCKALKHAHDHGIIHRDLKPANILLTDDDDVKLLDFGIARLFGGSHLTSAGGVLGTADYMSPEQADGRPVNERCDQYSLGGVLYALSAGRPPFRAATLLELLQLQRFAEPEPVRRYARDIPEGLERIIMQLLEKDPEQRFRNTMVLARHLTAMEKALSRPLKEDTFMLAGEDSTEPPIYDEPSGPTRVRGESPEEPAAVYVTQDFAPTNPDQAAAEPESEAAEFRAKPRTAESQFTTVEEERRRERQRESESWSALGLQLAGLAAGLALVVGGVWYFMRPASADTLYAAIQQAAEQGSDQALLTVKDEVGEFLERFPDDTRREEVTVYREEIELVNTESRLRARARQVGRRGGLTPLERNYVEAIRDAKANPERSIAQLAALLDLYAADGAELSDEERKCLILARRQLERLTEQVKTYATGHIAHLEDRLSLADKLRGSEPETARKIWQAILELYGDKPWAAEAVAKARAGLAAAAQHADAADTRRE